MLISYELNLLILCCYCGNVFISRNQDLRPHHDISSFDYIINLQEYSRVTLLKSIKKSK